MGESYWLVRLFLYLFGHDNVHVCRS
jgi:hypothetical protein